MKEEQKKHIVEMMKADEELGLYDIFNEEKRQGVKDLIDTHKQKLEKYSERFDNDKSEIGNPETCGKRVIEEPRPIHEQIIEHCGGEEKFKEIAGLVPNQETLEDASWKYNPLKKLDGEFLRHAFKEGAKWKEERMYNEEEVKPLLDAIKYFIDRVENGTIRSKTTYKMYKEIFEKFKNK
jgi:hypothetical protein